MDFLPDTEQRMIAESYAKVFAEGCASAEESKVWETLETLGLLRVTWPESYGGYGMGISDVLYTLIEAGRAAVLQPLLGAAILPGLALQRSEAAAPETINTTLCVAIADDHIRLVDGKATGVLRAVPGAVAEQPVLICLPDDRLVVLPVSTEGLTFEEYRMVDGRAAADLHFASVRMAAGTLVSDAPGLHTWMGEVAATAFAADALGAMLALRDMTQEYLQTRKQFGRPLSSFQALSHAMVDIYHDTEHFASLVHLAARACDRQDVALRQRAVSATKHYLGGRIRRAAASAIQLHGGIGVTEEYALGKLVKRVLVADMLNGSADRHTARLADLIRSETRARPTPPQRKEQVA